MNEQQNHLSQLLEQRVTLTQQLEGIQAQTTRTRDLMLKTQGAIEYLEATGVKLPEPETTEEETEVSEGAAWTKKSGKNKEGGLNEKGRKSYEAENPGSDLKAPSKKKGNKRRASFCARMKGMKKKLTSAKTARDPDSRINKSLRAWNC